VRARRASAHCFLETRESIRFSGRGDFHITIRLVSNPTGQAELTRFLYDVPAKSDTLHPATDLEMYAFRRGTIA